MAIGDAGGYRKLIALKWTYSRRPGPGRPRVMKTIVDLMVRMALDNPSRGYTRMQSALANLRHQVGRGTIANILTTVMPPSSLCGFREAHNGMPQSIWTLSAYLYRSRHSR
jgi:hypothetical protein